MGTNRTTQQLPTCCLIAGNHCHDVLIRDGVVLAHTLGGASSFICNVFDALSLDYNLISKVGSDFAYSLLHADPIVVPKSPTTLFYAHFDDTGIHGGQDRVLKRVAACDPIRSSDLPETRFDFGMVVGVGGEITVETVEKMVEICGTLFVDIQALIRVFDKVDGTVSLVGLKESGFFHLLPRIGFIKASAEEAVFMDVEEVRKVCCVVVTDGDRGCRVLWRDGGVEVGPFPTKQVDPTGAGDSFLGGFVAGLVNGLSVADAALLGNLFGSLTVGHIGLPKFDWRMLQTVHEEVQKRKVECLSFHDRKDKKFIFMNVAGHEQFHESLIAAKQVPGCLPCEREWDLPCSPSRIVEQGLNGLPRFTSQQKLLHDSIYEEPIRTVDGSP